MLKAASDEAFAIYYAKLGNLMNHSRKWRRSALGLPHPHSPASRMHDWSATGVPHPNSPAGQHFDWSLAGIPHPNSPAGQHFKHAPQLTVRQRFIEMLKLTPNHMGPELAAHVQAMLTPSSMAMIAGTFTALAVSQAFGVGEIVDIILLVVGALFVGQAALTAAKEIVDCVKTTVMAKTPADLDRAADQLAQAVAILGVVVFFALVAKVGEKFGGAAGAEEEGSAGAANATEEPAAQPSDKQGHGGTDQPRRGSQVSKDTSSLPKALSTPVPKESQALSRVDTRQILSRHLEDVNNHEAHFALLAEQAQIDREAGKFRSYLGRITEAKGERAAAEYMVANFKDFEMVAGFEPGPGIDQIWIKRSIEGEIEEIKIVEAKGPRARLAKGQMSKPWFKKKVKAMCNSRQDEHTQEIGKLLQKALDDRMPKIQGLVIESDPKGGAKRKSSIDYD